VPEVRDCFVHPRHKISDAAKSALLYKVLAVEACSELRRWYWLLLVSAAKIEKAGENHTS
jgi:hypothetical protein